MPWNVVVNNSQVLAIHAALLATGEILFFGGDEHSQAQHDSNNIDHTRLFRISDNAILPVTSPTTDVFCSSHAQLADGRILVAGGTAEWSGEDPHHGHALGFPGLRSTWIYQPRARSWFRAADMNPEPGFEAANTGGGRWYPTLLTLANGAVAAFFGHPGPTDTRHRNNNSEQYSPAGNFWLRLPEIAEAAAVSYLDRFLNYSRVHLLRDGRVFFCTPIGGNHFYDPATGTFTGPTITALADGMYQDWSGQSVLLPLLPGDGYRPRILQTGDQIARRIDLGAASPAWNATAGRSGPAMGTFRHYGSAVILPTGQVLVCGGINTPNGSATPDASAVLEPEIYEPGIDWAAGAYVDGADSWVTINEPATVARNYHSTALLMPDGRVWTAGSNHNANTGDPAVEGEHRIEVFSPDYVASGARPQITSAPALVSYGEAFTIQTAQAGSIRRVAMIRCGTMTHSGDFDQRYVGLQFTASAGALTATAPPTSAVAPPGYYLLFIVDNANLPCSEASVVRLTSIACFIITDRSTFSSFEVDAFLDVGMTAHFDSAFFAVFDGFMPHEIGTPLPAPAIDFWFDMVGGAAVPGVAIDVLPGAPEDASLPPDVAQRFTWPCTIRFTNHDAFTTFTETRDVTVRVSVGTRSCLASIRLMKQPNPYMIDGEPSWLSTDVRVFKVSGNGMYRGIPQGTGTNAAFDFLGAFLAACRGAPHDSNHPFERISPDQMTSQLDLATTDAGGNSIFNYAIARVRYRASTVAADHVRLFFRTFNTAATTLEYHAAPDQPYARLGDGPTAHPLLGTLGGELVSIPYFGQPRTPDLAMQNDDVQNVQTISAGGPTETWQFFGCWLDFNRDTPAFPVHPVGTGPYTGGQPIQDLIRGRHICLVAEVHFPPDPIADFATPGSSDNLAQRNLAIAHSDNPGNEASHTVQHTIMLKPSFEHGAVSLGYEAFGAPAPFAESLVSHQKRPRFADELLIRWYDLPRDSRVTLFFSDVDADEILAMAGARLGPAILSKIDMHTIECRVAGDVAYIPLPGGRTSPIPGLLTIQLPGSVVDGENYRVSVHQCSGLTRRIIGAFQISIPIRTADTIVPEESRSLSVLRRIAQSLSPADHWYPVFQRYVGQFGDHVRGLGGDPDSIHPNRDGSGRPEPGVKRLCSEKWAYAAMVASTLVAVAVGPALLAPLIAITLVAATAFACLWFRRCRPRSCEVLTLTLLATVVAAALISIAAIAGAGKPWMWIVLALVTIAVAILSIAIALRGCCDCAEVERVPASVFREIGLYALQKPKLRSSPMPRRQATKESQSAAPPPRGA